MDKLLELIRRCEGGVLLDVNEHRNLYQAPADWLKEQDEEVEESVVEKIVSTGQTVDLRFYPHTPVGFFRIIHFDVEQALDEALLCLGPA